MIPGGTSQLEQPNDEANQILNSVKDELVSKSGHTGEVILLGYKTQVVAGTNYFMKISIGEKVVHARVFQPLSGESAELHSIEDKNHDKDSELSYF